MQQNLLRFKDKQKYFLFDLETCHLNLSSTDNKPWQIGYILGEGKNIIDMKAHMIKWDELNITEGAARVTHFNRDNYLSRAVDPILILDEIEQYIYNDEYIILGHNILGFDVYIHNIWRRLLGRKTDYSYISRCLDTNALAKSIKLNRNLGKNENLTAFQYRLLDHKEKGLKTNLTVLGKEYGIDFDPEKLHDAGNDVDLNWKIWNKMVWQLEI